MGQFLSSEAQYQMMEDLKAKGEVKYYTKLFTGKAFRTSQILARIGLAKVRAGREDSGKQFIVVSLTEKGKAW